MALSKLGGCSQVIGMEEHQFTWKVDNFKSIQGSSELLKTQFFYFRMGMQIGLPTDWMIYLDTIVRDSPTIHRVGLYIRLLQKPVICKEANIAFQFQVRNSSRKRPYWDSKKMKVGNMTEYPLGWGSNIIPLSQDVTKLPVNPEGALIFDIQVTLYSTKRIELAMEFIHRYKQVFTQKHQYDMGEMFQLQRNSIFLIADSPTKIVTGDGTEFPVNRGIISARSEVFRTMFQQSQMTEAQNGEVHVNDISAKAMKVLLHFLYTGQLIQDEWYKTDTLVELMYAAGKYQLADLLSFLDQIVGLLCNERNMGKLLNLARKLNLKKAEEDLFNFIKGHVKTYDEMKALVENPAMEFEEESSHDRQ